MDLEEFKENTDPNGKKITLLRKSCLQHYLFPTSNAVKQNEAVDSQVPLDILAGGHCKMSRAL